MSAKRTKTGGKTHEKGKKKKPSREAIGGTRRKAGAEAQSVREGSPTVIATRLADRERTGDIRRGPEEEEPFPEDMMDADDFDAELPLDDEDESRLLDLDGDVEDGAAAVGLPAGGSFSDAVPGGDAAYLFELRISEDGACAFLRPQSISGEATTDNGEEEFEEIERRFLMLEEVAAWLTKNRGDFLRRPDPTHLGANALSEMEKGLASATPGGFLLLSGISQRQQKEQGIKADSVESLFSRYVKATALVWEDGSPMPLDFLFGAEARNAWVACAVRQFFEKIKRPLTTPEAIDRLRGITVPKDRSKKKALAKASLTSLTQPEFVARANQMAGTKWEDVMKRHFQPSPNE